jgi:ribonucleotide monophosphatase NagD (HAD superfamily)
VTATPRPRLAALDLDGTLLQPDGSASARTADALRRDRARGLRLVFVTARPPRSVRLLVRPLWTPGARGPTWSTCRRCTAGAAFDYAGTVFAFPTGGSSASLNAHLTPT